MTAREFRTMALSFPGALEKSHFDHPDFRVGGKIFATLGYPHKGWGMARLSPKRQKAYVDSNPDTFFPANGKWGLRGATIIHLRHAERQVVREALVEAWRMAAPRRLSTI